MDRQKPRETRRDFLGFAAWGMGLTAVGASLWTVFGATTVPGEPGLSPLHVDLSRIPAGELQSFWFDRKNLTIWRRTPDQVTQARGVEMASIRDPLARNANLDPKARARDENRSYGDLLVTWAVCTRLGCIPLGQAGDFGGWFCSCCATHYDLSGRVRKGPAPRNLAIPRYEIADGILSVYPDGAGPVSDDQLDRLLRG